MIITLLPLRLVQKKYSRKQKQYSKKKQKQCYHNTKCLQKYFTLFIKYLVLFYIRFPIQKNIVLSTQEEFNKEHDNLRIHFNIYETSYISQWSLLKFLKYLKPNDKHHVINKPQICTICQEKINKKEDVFKCAHCDYQFHIECISKWLGCKHSQLQCPNCRQFFFYKSPIYF